MRYLTPSVAKRLAVQNLTGETPIVLTDDNMPHWRQVIENKIGALSDVSTQEWSYDRFSDESSNIAIAFIHSTRWTTIGIVRYEGHMTLRVGDDDQKTHYLISSLAEILSFIDAIRQHCQGIDDRATKREKVRDVQYQSIRAQCKAILEKRGIHCAVEWNGLYEARIYVQTGDKECLTIDYPLKNFQEFESIVPDAIETMLAVRKSGVKFKLDKSHRAQLAIGNMDQE